MSRLIHIILTLSLCSISLLADEPAQKDQKNWRVYRDGPLTADDFLGKPPAADDPNAPTAGGGGSLTAYTMTEIMYDTRFQFVGTPGRWTARVVKADAYAVVHRDRSWNRRPMDARLLDHEQGHFDLAHSFAMAMQQHLMQRMKSRRLPVGTGATSAEANRDLQNKLAAELKPFIDANVQAQTEYDRLTQHGLLASVQSEQRQQQLAKIKELNEQLNPQKKGSK